MAELSPHLTARQHLLTRGSYAQNLAVQTLREWKQRRKECPAIGVSSLIWDAEGTFPQLSKSRCAVTFGQAGRHRIHGGAVHLVSASAAGKCRLLPIVKCS